MSNHDAIESPLSQPNDYVSQQCNRSLNTVTIVSTPFADRQTNIYLDPPNIPGVFFIVNNPNVSAPIKQRTKKRNQAEERKSSGDQANKCRTNSIV